MLLGEPQEEGVELCSFVVAQSGEEFVLEPAGEAAEAFERLPSAGCHLDQLSAAVLWVAPTLDEAGVLELVEEPDQWPLS